MEAVSYDSRDELLRSCSSVVLYGAGGIGRAVQRALAAQGLLVRGVLDRRAAPGATIDGTPVWSPGSPQAAQALADPDVLVVVSVFNREADLAEIADTLRVAGARRVMSFFSFYHLFAGDLEPYWLAPRTFLDGHSRRIEWLRGRLADAKSVGLLDALVQQRRTGSMSFPTPDPYSEQYVPRDIEALTSPKVYEHVVDCGAFDGDSLVTFGARFGRLKAASCFEPDVANFSKLARRVRTDLPVRPTSVVLWPCGVWDSTTQLCFESGAGEGSRVTSRGTSVIQTVSLDEALGETPPPTLIKMDIEGAEVRALRGARRIIAACRPALAVSAYHTPAHLWQIPELIASWELGYQFYLRLYAHQGFDLVLYAVAGGNDAPAKS